MTIAQLRQLAAWHRTAGQETERQAAALQRSGFSAEAAETRELAQFHASTAILLDEHADAFAGAFTPAEAPRPFAA